MRAVSLSLTNQNQALFEAAPQEARRIVSQSPVLAEALMQGMVKLDNNRPAAAPATAAAPQAGAGSAAPSATGGGGGIDPAQALVFQQIYELKEEVRP